MKILQVNNKFNGAGAEYVMKTLGEQLKQRNHHVSFVTYQNNNGNNVNSISGILGRITESIENFSNKKASDIYKKRVFSDSNDSLFKNISTNYRNLIPKGDIIYNTKYKRYLNKLKPDIIHYHNLLPYLSSLKISKNLGIPSIITLHGYWTICPLANLIQRKNKSICNKSNWNECEKNCDIKSNVSRYMSRMRDYVNNNITTLVPVSNYVKDRIIDFGYPDKKIRVIHNGINTDLFKKEGNDIKFRVLHVGRLSFHKGSHIFIKAAKILENKIPQIKFVLIGNKGKAFGEHKNIEIINWLSHRDLQKEYSSSLCVVVPSIWPEPHPLICLEAMACSTPVIGSKISGIEESITENKTGFLINVSNADKMAHEIAKKITYLYENNKERKKLGSQAHSHVMNNFRIEQMTDKYEELYSEISK